MDAPGPIKKVPKWAWVASAGVVGGVAVMRMRANKGSQVDKTSDATAPGDYSQAVESFPASGVVGSDIGSAGYGGGGGSNVDVPGLIDSIGNIFAQAQPPQQDLGDIIAAIGALPGFAGGGGAPVSTTTAAAPQTQDAAPVAPSPVAASAPSAPAPAPKPAAVSSGPQCSSAYPFRNGNDCYKVVCANGKGDHAKGRWHFYQSGKEVHVASTC